MDKQNLSDQIIILANEKQLHCLVITAQQSIKNQKNKIKEKPSKNITFLLESKLIEYDIDRAKYHGVDLEGKDSFDNNHQYPYLLDFFFFTYRLHIF